MEKAKSKASKKTTAAGTSHPRERYEFWYESMLLIRRFEEKAGQLYGQQKIKVFAICTSGRKPVPPGQFQHPLRMINGLLLTGIMVCRSLLDLTPKL